MNCKASQAFLWILIGSLMVVTIFLQAQIKEQKKEIVTLQLDKVEWQNKVEILANLVEKLLKTDAYVQDVIERSRGK